jgi:hypothetical protein
MHTLSSTSDFAIIDDFLPPDEFRALWKDVRSTNYRHVHADQRRKVFRLADGDPFEGPSVYSEPPPTGLSTRELAFPTDRPIDAVFARIFESCHDWASVIGRRQDDWHTLTAKAHMYPPGTSLSWHGDGLGRTGAYALYVHPVWSPHWGGETLLAQPAIHETDRISADYVCDPFSSDGGAESRELLSPGSGTFVFPRPNRLLLIRAGVRHRVNAAHLGSGAEMRCSVSGFFLTRSPANDR